MRQALEVACQYFAFRVAELAQRRQRKTRGNEDVFVFRSPRAQHRESALLGMKQQHERQRHARHRNVQPQNAQGAAE